MSVTQSEKIDQLAAALVKAQQQVEGAKKDSENPFFRSRYADLASVWLACRGALTGNGLSVAQFPGYQDGVALLTTVLLHESGQWIAGTAGAPLTGKTAKDGSQLPPDAQSVGAATTYLRRFALAAVAGVVQEDDDGEGLAGRGKAGTGRLSGRGPKEPPPAPPPADLTQIPPALSAPEEALPYEALTRLQPCPLAPRQMTIGSMTGRQLRVFEDWLSGHPDAPRAEEWMVLVKAELAAR